MCPGQEEWRTKRGRSGRSTAQSQRHGVFGWLQADTVAAVWTAAAAIHREKNTVEAAAAAGLQPQQAAANKLTAPRKSQHEQHCLAPGGFYFGPGHLRWSTKESRAEQRHRQNGGPPTLPPPTG
jgi:predicted metalloprotease